jgi:hypothetical protein
MLVPKLNVGATFGVTVTVNVTGPVTHCPAVGVKVYTPEFWLLTTAGFQVPVMPFVELPGKVGTDAPAQIVSVVPKLNVGVRFGFTVTLNVTGNAQIPAVGVNVYTPEFWLSTEEGLQVPVIPLVDVVGNVGTVLPAQIVNVVPKLNVGVTFGLTVTLKVAVTAHWPAVGVNVYVPEFWLLTADGLQVPVIPLSDGEYKVGTALPAQIVNVVPKLKVGVTFGLTVTVKTVATAHWPAVGVNV